MQFDHLKIDFLVKFAFEILSCLILLPIRYSIIKTQSYRKFVEFLVYREKLSFIFYRKNCFLYTCFKVCIKLVSDTKMTQ